MTHTEYGNYVLEQCRAFINQPLTRDDIEQAKTDVICNLFKRNMPPVLQGNYEVAAFRILDSVKVKQETN